MAGSSIKAFPIGSLDFFTGFVFGALDLIAAFFPAGLAASGFDVAAGGFSFEDAVGLAGIIFLPLLFEPAIEEVGASVAKPDDWAFASAGFPEGFTDLILVPFAASVLVFVSGFFSTGVATGFATAFFSAAGSTFTGARSFFRAAAGVGAFGFVALEDFPTLRAGTAGFAMGFAATVFFGLITAGLLSGLEIGMVTGFFPALFADDLLATCFPGFAWETTFLRAGTADGCVFRLAGFRALLKETLDFATDFLAGLVRRDFFLTGDFMRRQIVRIQLGVVRNHSFASLGRCLAASNGFCHKPNTTTNRTQFHAP